MGFEVKRFCPCNSAFVTFYNTFSLEVAGIVTEMYLLPRHPLLGIIINVPFDYVDFIYKDECFKITRMFRTVYSLVVCEHSCLFCMN